jgi:hypothetical protein
MADITRIYGDANQHFRLFAVAALSTPFLTNRPHLSPLTPALIQPFRCCEEANKQKGEKAEKDSEQKRGVCFCIDCSKLLQALFAPNEQHYERDKRCEICKAGGKSNKTLTASQQWSSLF